MLRKNKQTNFLADKREEQAMLSRRIYSLGFMVILLAALLVARLYFLQVIEHNRYSTLSKQNQLNLIPITPKRGLIYDRNGVLLAENLPGYSLEIIPDRVKNLNQTIKALSQLIKITPYDRDLFFKQIHYRHRFDPTPLRLHLSDIEVASFAVNQHHFPGVILKPRMIRHYPLGNLMAHVIGYVGRINERDTQRLDPTDYAASNFTGKVGIERHFEHILHGKPGYETVETDVSGRVVRTLKRKPPQSGNDIVLTIDTKLQKVGRAALGEQKGAVIALDTSNGEVLALVSNPSYDPNIFVHGLTHKMYHHLRTAKERPMYNRAIHGLYPLASTVKPFLALGALDQNIVNTKYKIFDKGFFKLPGNNHIYKDWKKTGHGTMNITRAIIVSCDTYFYTIANKMGIIRLANILRMFGFGQLTGIEIDEEVKGIVPDPKWKRRNRGKPWYTGDTLVSGIGQGYILTTPIQLAKATAIMSMKGENYQPHLLLSQKLPSNEFLPYALNVEKLIELNNPKNWDIVQKAMRAVITSGEGTGSRFGRDAPYPVAAKTGTAQVFSAKNHANLDRKNLPEHLRDHSLFIAFAPYKNPKLVVVAVVENSKRASNVARIMMDYYFKQKQPTLPIIPHHEQYLEDDYVG